MNSATADQRLTTLFEDYYDEVAAYCARRIGLSEADDVATDVFAVAWRRIDEIDWETVRPWLYGIARGVLANRWRSRRRQRRLAQTLSAIPVSPPETPESQVVRRDQDAEVIAAMGKLRASDQEILMLAAWEELSAPEIGAALAISTSAAEQRLHRAKKRLARLLAPPAPTQISPRAVTEEEGGR